MKKMSDSKTKSVKGGAAVTSKAVKSEDSIAKREKVLKNSILGLLGEYSNLVAEAKKSGVTKDKLKRG